MLSKVNWIEETRHQHFTPYIKRIDPNIGSRGARLNFKYNNKFMEGLWRRRRRRSLAWCIMAKIMMSRGGRSNYDLEPFAITSWYFWENNTASRQFQDYISSEYYCGISRSEKENLLSYTVLWTNDKMPERREIGTI